MNVEKHKQAGENLTKQVIPKTPAPSYDIIFWDDTGEIGRIDWSSGKMEFSGDMEESAKVFFNYLKSMVDDYIRNKGADKGK